MYDMMLRGYVFRLYDILFNFFEGVWSSTYNKYLGFKYYYFNNKILKLAVYNTNTKAYIELFDYDNLFYLAYLYFMMILGYEYNITDWEYWEDYSPENNLVIMRVVRDNKIHNVISESKLEGYFDNTFVKNSKLSLVYCTCNEMYDLTDIFLAFLPSFFINQSIRCKWYVDALTKFAKVKMDDCKYELKCMLYDDKCQEKIFKDNDIIIFK
jgi:hypothetical protein